MKAQLIFMTGATSGLGKAAAFDLASNGSTLLIAHRSKIKVGEVIKEFTDQFPKAKGKLIPIECDLASFRSVRQACERIKSDFNYLDQLILNAGVWHFQFHESKDGIEENLQVNVLSNHLIIDELLPWVEASKSGRIILTSSGLHQGKIAFENLEFRDDFSGIKAYRQSKLGVILMTRWFHKKWEGRVGIYCQHPGLVNTNLSRHAKWFGRFFFKLMGTNPKKGAKTLLYLAKSPQKYLTSGEYYWKSKLTKTTLESYDMDAAERLIDVSLKIRNFE